LTILALHSGGHSSLATQEKCQSKVAALTVNNDWLPFERDERNKPSLLGKGTLAQYNQASEGGREKQVI